MALTVTPLEWGLSFSGQPGQAPTGTTGGVGGIGPGANGGQGGNGTATPTPGLQGNPGRVIIIVLQ